MQPHSEEDRLKASDPAGKASFAAPASANILVIRLKSMGDVLFTLPAVHALRDHFPGAKITFLTSKENRPLIEGFRDVNEIIEIDRSIFHRGNPWSVLRETWSLLRRLRREKFSLAVDFQSFGETALLTWLTGAPERWGSVYQPVRGWAYTRRIKRNTSIHPGTDNLSLLQQCGLPVGRIRNEFVLPEPVLAEARRLFSKMGLDVTGPTLFIQPFTSTPAKNWPLEKYLALASHWRSRKCQVLFGGGPKDRALLEPVIQAGFPTSAGASLLVTAGLTKLCSFIVGGDTGLIYLVVAMGKRAVILMSSRARDKTVSFPQYADLPLTPPPGREISDIAVEVVVKACERCFIDARPTDIPA